MEAELDEFGFHGDPRNTEPAGRFGLVATRLLDGPREKFAFGRFEDARVNAGEFLAPGGGEQFVNVFAEGTHRGISFLGIPA